MLDFRPASRSRSRGVAGGDLASGLSFPSEAKELCDPNFPSEAKELCDPPFASEDKELCDPPFPSEDKELCEAALCSSMNERGLSAGDGLGEAPPSVVLSEARDWSDPNFRLSGLVIHSQSERLGCSGGVGLAPALMLRARAAEP